MAVLAADLRPVAPLRPPVTRAALWIGLVAALAVLMAVFNDCGHAARALTIAPDLWLSVTGSTLTAVLAAVAAFHLGVPGREAAWALLPLPGLALWFGASGLGCLRTWGAPLADETARDCLPHIILLSLPLMGLMVPMLGRCFSVRPDLTALVAGLAVAAAAASLLNFTHPYDASAEDLAAHLVAVLLVIGLNQAVSRRFGLGAGLATGRTTP